MPRRTRNWVVTTNSLSPPSRWSKSKKRTLRVSCPRGVLTVRGNPKVRYSCTAWLRAMPTSLTCSRSKMARSALFLRQPVVETEQGGPQSPPSAVPRAPRFALPPAPRAARMSTPAAPAGRGAGSSVWLYSLGAEGVVMESIQRCPKYAPQMVCLQARLACTSLPDTHSAFLRFQVRYVQSSIPWAGSRILVAWHVRTPRSCLCQLHRNPRILAEYWPP